MSTDRCSRRIAWLALAALAPAVLAYGAATRQLTGTDAFYALVARQVAEAGTWVPLMRRGPSLTGRRGAAYRISKRRAHGPNP